MYGQVAIVFIDVDDAAEGGDYIDADAAKSNTPGTHLQRLGSGRT